jgi:hypothetical protein
MDRPKTVSYGVKLYLLALVMGFPSFIFFVLNDAPAGQSKPVILIGGLFFIALAVLLVYKIQLGRNWARQIFAGLTIVGIASALTSGVSGRTAQVILFWVQTLLSITSTILFYRPSSNLWFNLQPTRKK